MVSLKELINKKNFLLKDRIKVFLMQHPYVCFFSTFIGMPIVALVVTFLVIAAIMLPISYFMK